MSDRRLKVNVAVDMAAGPVVDALPDMTDCGFEVEIVLDILGVVVGTIPVSEIVRLRALPRVVAVDESGELGLID